MAFNSLDELAAAGTDLSNISDAQRQVLSHLTRQEVDTIVSVKARLDGAEGDVEAHTEIVGGVLF